MSNYTKKLTKKLKQQQKDYPQVQWSSIKQFRKVILDEFEYDIYLASDSEDDYITYYVNGMKFDENGLLRLNHCPACDHVCY